MGNDSDALLLALAIAALAAAALACGVGAWRQLHRLRLIEDTPTAKARSAHQGYVELEGVARAMEHAPVIARLSALPCCWYRYRIEALTLTHVKGRAQRRWELVDHGASTDGFWLEDDTGRVAVDPEGADVWPRHRDQWRSRSPLAGIARGSSLVAGLLASHGGATQYRLTEERINRGDPLYALGMLKNVSSHRNAPTLAERTRAIVAEWKRDAPRLRERFDLDKDGRIDEREWMLALRMARRAAERARAETALPSTEAINLLTHPRDGQRPYILSAYPQRELARRKRVWALVYVLGFFGSGALAAWLSTRA